MGFLVHHDNALKNKGKCCISEVRFIGTIGYGIAYS